MIKNQVFTGECIDYTYDGMGVVRYDNFPFFVKDMIVGEKGQIIITKLLKDYGYGKLLKLEETSPQRVTPTCPVSRQCGGCQLQHMSADEQARFKQNTFRNALKRIGGLDCEVREILRAEKPFGYRNKVQLPVRQGKNGELITGFYRVNSHDIIPVEHCYLQSEVANDLINRIKDIISEHDVSKYIRHIVIKEFEATGETMVVLVTNALRVPLVEDIGRLIGRENRVKSVIQNINDEDTNVVLGKRERVLYGSDHVRDSLDGLLFEIACHSFYQVNSRQTSVLYNTAIKMADLNGNDTVMDLYCGVGTIGLFASRYVKKVLGVEIVESAIINARRNAEINGITNAEFVCGDVEKTIEGNREHIDVIFVDPPRKGCSRKTIDSIVRIAPERLVYVSCNPATLARDLKILGEEGYEVKAVQPVDMFPQTHHVETVCLLSKLSEAKHRISVQVDMDELDLTAAESKATYEEIQEWVKEEYGFHVTHLNIAQVKRKHGIIERENYYKAKSPDSKQPGCPEEKVKAIEAALKHFQMIE